MLKKYIYKIMTLAVITLLTLIFLKSNIQFRNVFYKNIYSNNISFAKINNWYWKTFGSPLPFSEYFNDNLPVFNEKITYSKADKYQDGVALSVAYDYLVPSLDSGIVIFIGEKEGYGNTLILQQENGLDVWYSNLKEVNLKLYDYIKKGTLIGSVDSKLYLVFNKDGYAVDYEKYI